MRSKIAMKGWNRHRNVTARLDSSRTSLRAMALPPSVDAGGSEEWGGGGAMGGGGGGGRGGGGVRSPPPPPPPPEARTAGVRSIVGVDLDGDEGRDALTGCERQTGPVPRVAVALDLADGWLDVD
jgi:hypothetical protein